VKLFDFCEICTLKSEKMNAEQLESLIKGQTLGTALKLISENFSGKIVFSTSFGSEDQVITDAIAGQKIENIEIFTLDTGRLFPETYSLWSRTCDYYNVKISTYFPDSEKVGKYVSENGINAFYRSIELRKACCYIRKVEPLQKALHGAKLWITGLRAEQSPERSDLEIFERDETYDLIKFHPLLDWTLADVKTYLRENHVPYNPLFDKGFVSIGCAPCTRAVGEGENFRSGRWWWEESEKKECGLHIKNTK
jgi:phosphoadenosine phosphosulfate reductase